MAYIDVVFLKNYILWLFISQAYHFCSHDTVSVFISKVKNCASRYSTNSTVRKTGSYIYEEFLATDGTDVKVYAVGPDYAHAEARKSPVSIVITFELVHFNTCLNSFLGT